jgi:hypothetical protein
LNQSKFSEELNNILLSQGAVKTSLISAMIIQTLVQASISINDFADDIRKKLGLPVMHKVFEQEEIVEEVEVPKNKKQAKPAKVVKKKPEMDEEIKKQRKEWSPERKKLEYQYKLMLRQKLHEMICDGFSLLPPE